jgi:hypothetical protein
MPRVTNTGEEVKQWAERTGEIPTWGDLCFECADSERDTADAFQDDLSVEGRQEPQGMWEVGAEHPPYDQEDYSCEICSKKLTEEDD